MAEGHPEFRHTIAAVSQRTGLSVHTLRAWERRYGIPRPRRSAGRYRIYGPEDLDLIRRMQAAIAEGAPAAEAARRARAGAVAVPAGPHTEAALRTELIEAFVAFDGHRVQRLLTRGETAYGTIGLLDLVVVPVMHQVGALWQADTLGVDVEHFASVVVRARLHAIVESLDRRGDPRALLACAPGEAHEIALLALSIRLATAGWAITNLGANLPTADLLAAMAADRPRLVAISVTDPANLPAALAAAAAARGAAEAATRVVLGGQGVTDAAGLPDGVETEAALLARLEATAG